MFDLAWLQMWQAITLGFREKAMTIPVDVLAQQLLQLSAQDRARLLDQVISSLDADRERDARWNALAAQRDAEADADPSVLVSGPEAIARVRASLG
ncbi:MAG TPA: addiction module protein [Pseudomonadota bacterium]|nr:addiction module protein [Pseudomonadota bacterium]